MKIYSSVKLPENAVKLIKENGYKLLMNESLSTPNEEEIIQNSKNCDAIIAAVNVPITKNILENNKNIKILANVGAGYNNIDIETAKNLSIRVTNTPSPKSTESTAELAFLHILALSRHLKKGLDIMKQDEYEGWQVMSYLGGNQVTGKTLAIIGFGNVGRQLAKYANAFNMKILYVNSKNIEMDFPAEKVSLEEALKNADFIVLQASFKKENYHMIGEKEFSLMKKNSYFINTARGGMVDEDALVKALKEKKIAGAGIDTHENEPHPNKELLKMDNVILTPHIGNDTIEARNEMALFAVNEVIKALQGEKLTYEVY